MIKTNNSLAVYSNDFGGAFNTLVYLHHKKKLYKNNKYYFFGPAKLALSFFKIKKKNEINFSKLNLCKEFIYSLSKNKKYEKKILDNIKIKKTLCLDGWGNFLDKMKIKKRLYYPDEIIVFDEIAKKIVNSEKKLKNTKKIFLKDLIFKFLKKKIKKKKNRFVVYLTSPLVKLDNKKYLLLKKMAKKMNLLLIIKYHPNQIKLEKTKESTFKNMFDYLSNAKIVIGHQSSLLVYASKLGIKSYSINKKDYFNWEKYKIFENFGITSLNNFNELINETNK